MYIVHPDVAMTRLSDGFVIEDHAVRVQFHSDSGNAAQKIIECLGKSMSIDEVHERTGYSVNTINNIVAEFEKDSFVLRVVYPRDLDSASAIVDVRRSGLFWNKHVMSQRFPVALFSGNATRANVFGWGLEFYHFVRGAREYMARGAARTNGHSKVFCELWNHFAEEAFHDEMFCKGLVECGIGEHSVKTRPPIASTRALLNHLWECAEEGELEYAAVFAFMQPSASRQSVEEIDERYSSLTSMYPFAKKMFDAFAEHDKIDVGLEHYKLSIESLLEYHGNISGHTMSKIGGVIKATADAFDAFFTGIERYYRSDVRVQYRQIPRMI